MYMQENKTLTSK